jgi:hypothetical protein
MKKENEKGFSALVGRGGFQPSRVRARECRPSTAQERKTAWALEETASGSRVHAPGRVGGETTSAVDGAGANQPTARRGGAVQGRDHSERGRSGANFSVRRVQAGRRRGRWPAAIALKPCAAREMGWLTGGVKRPQSSGTQM